MAFTVFTHISAPVSPTVAMVRLLLLHATLVGASSASLPPDFTRSYSGFSASLRGSLLENYDKMSPPTSVRRVNYSAAGTDVTLNIRFYKIDKVSLTDGMISFKVWWRMQWVDDRLSWDPASHGNISNVRFGAQSFSDFENTEIWLPDIQPYNAHTGLMHTLDPAPALVTANGSVYWSRPGMLTVMCRFAGLVMYPFDELSCPMEVGGWISGGGTQGLNSFPSPEEGGEGCASLPQAEETSLQSYQEMSITKIACYPDVYEYPCCPNDPYPVVRYRIFLKRADFYYWTSTIVPLMLFTLLSFSVFFMSFEVGERLGVGVTLVLTIEFARLSLSSQLPVCGEWLWIELIFTINFFFAIISLLESCVVLAIAYNEAENLLPKGFQDILTAAHGYVTHMGGRVARVADVAAAAPATAFPNARRRDDFSSAACQLLQEGTNWRAGLGKISSIASMAPAMPSLLPRTSSEVIDDGSANHPYHPHHSEAHHPIGESKKKGKIANSDANKLLFFENLFFRLDVDGGGTIDFDEVRRMLAFTALDMSPEERERQLRAADTREADGALDRFEFLDLCVNMLWSQPLEQLETAATSYADFRSALKRRHNTYWRSWAHYIDRQCRFWVPTAWGITMWILWGLNLEDDYLGVSMRGPSEGGLPADHAARSLGASAQVITASALTESGMYTTMSQSLNNIRITFSSWAVVGFVLGVVFSVLRLMFMWHAFRNSKLKQHAAREKDDIAERVESYNEASSQAHRKRSHGIVQGMKKGLKYKVPSTRGSTTRMPEVQVPSAANGSGLTPAQAVNPPRPLAPAVEVPNENDLVEEMVDAPQNSP